jgi:excisionase family DNA binding protein
MSNSTSTETRLLYDRKSAAQQLSVSVRTIDYLVANKELDTRRIGKKVLVTRASLVRYAAGNHFAIMKARKKGVASETHQAVAMQRTA